MDAALLAEQQILPRQSRRLGRLIRSGALCGLLHLVINRLALALTLTYPATIVPTIGTAWTI